MSKVVALPSRRGAPPFEDGRRVFDLFPVGGITADRWMYAVGLNDGRIKIGIANRPRKRIQSYWMTHIGIAWAHLFPKVGDYARAREVEKRCITELSRVATRRGRSEYFSGCSRAEVLAVCRSVIEGRPCIDVSAPEAAA